MSCVDPATWAARDRGPSPFEQVATYDCVAGRVSGLTVDVT